MEQKIVKQLRASTVPRLALSPDEAARALGVSRDLFEEHIAPDVRTRRREHSPKPGGAYELIERAYPHCSTLELFCRGRPRLGWSALGNEFEQ